MSNIIGTHANENGETVKVFAGIYDFSGWDYVAEYISEAGSGAVFSVQRLGFGVVKVVEHHDNVLAFSESYGHELEKLDEPGFSIEGYVPLKGFTGQHGYDGAMMHTSEVFSSGMARMCANKGGKFYLDYVEYETLDGLDLESAGWFLMHKADD